MKKSIKWIVFACFLTVISTLNCFAMDSINLKEVDYLDKYEVVYQNMVDKIKYAGKSGDVNVDCLVYLLPYEQFGVEFSKSELRYGSNEKIKEVVTDLVKETKANIKSMEKILKNLEKNLIYDEVKEATFLDQFNQIYEEMLVNLQGNKDNPLDSVDQDYLDKIIIYLDYEQRFANLILVNTDQEQVKSIAERIIKNQEKRAESIHSLQQKQE